MPTLREGMPPAVWIWKPERPDNHYWDCLVGSAVAGSMLGATPDGLERKSARRSPSERPTLADLAGRR